MTRQVTGQMTGQQPCRGPAPAGLPVIVALLLVPVLMLILAGCAGTQPRSFTTWQILAPDAETIPAEATLHGIPLRTGQIVASEQASAQSLFMTLVVAEPYRYIHTGLVVVEDGIPWVYEAVGRFDPPVLSSAPPTAFIGGGVRRVRLGDYLERQRLVMIFEPPPGADPAAMARYARDSLAARTPFDPWFDRGDSARVYCTEYTALALAAGGAPPRATLPLNPNPSVRVVTDWLRIAGPEVIPGEAIVADARPLALISRPFTPAQVEAYFAAKAELHRRFTTDQKVGNVLRFSGFGGLRFQPPVQEFLDAVRSAALGWEGRPPHDVAAAVREIAAARLGPAPSR